jgi:hypothetical protein
MSASVIVRLTSSFHVKAAVPRRKAGVTVVRC